MPSGKSGYLNVRLDPEHFDRLREIAADCGLYPGKVASMLLAEIIPTVKQVRPRIQIIRHERPGQP